MPTARAIDEPGSLDVRASLIRSALEAITGIRVAKVLAWYPDQTADLQLVRRRWYGKGRGRAGTAVVEEPLPRVPVGWWRFGKMLLAGELEAGDEVLVVGMAREFRQWWTSGQAFDTESEAMHSGRDVFCLPWLSSLARPMVARAARTFYMGREDGTAGITIPMDVPARLVVDAGPAGIVLGSAATLTVLKYPPFAAAFATWAGAIASAGQAVAAPGVPDPTGALYTAYAAAVTSATATLATAIATAPTMGTTKVVAE